MEQACFSLRGGEVISVIRPLAGRCNNFLNDVLRVFQTPFIGLSIILWFYYVLSYIALPGNQTWLGLLPDSDDYTYLSQTLDWIQGQGWFDNIQHRMSPPEGVPIHYTRFAEMPIAAVIMLFRLFDYSWRGAALLTSFTLPLIYLGVFFWALRKAADRFVSQDWSRLSVFVAMFAPFLMFKFAPGQVDHHGLEAILTITALGLTARMFEYPDKIKWALSASFVFTLSLVIGLETLPWMVLSSLVIGFWAIFFGAKASRSAAAYGLGLLAFGAVFLALVRGGADIYRPDLLSYSVVYVALMDCIAVSLCVAAVLATTNNVKIRFVASGAVAAVLGALFLLHFPDLLKGPYGAMDQRLAALFFANLEEALSLFARLGPYKSFLSLILPILSLVASLYWAHEEKDHKRWNWILFAFLLAASTGLAVFYQIRFMIYVQLFFIIPLAAFAERGWKWIARTYEGRRRFWAEIWLVLLIGPLTTVFLYGLQDGRSFNVGVLMFPARSVTGIFNMHDVATILSLPPYNDRSLRIMNMIGDGAELLFFTSHQVMSAPYHTNVRGNMEAIDFFSTKDPEEAKRIAQRNDIDLVVLNHYIPTMYLNNEKTREEPATDKSLSPQSDDGIAIQLVRWDAPAWLKIVPTPKSSNFSIFEVQKTKSK